MGHVQEATSRKTGWDISAPELCPWASSSFSPNSLPYPSGIATQMLEKVTRLKKGAWRTNQLTPKSPEKAQEVTAKISVEVGGKGCGQTCLGNN